MKTTTVYRTDSIRWSLDEITEPEQAEESAKLMKLINSGRGFDIGWVGMKKEIVSFNIRRERKGKPVIVSVCESMDEFPELLSDADWDIKSKLPKAKQKKYKPLTEEDINTIMEDDEYAWAIDSIATEVTHEKELGKSPTLAEISDGLMEVWHIASEDLNDGFEICKNLVRDYKAGK